MGRIAVIASFLLCCLFFGISHAQEKEHVYAPHPHKHKQYAKVKNPIPMGEQTIKKGAELYEKHCIGCHGKAGKAGGRLALAKAVYVHGDTDGEIFHVISDGIKGTPMRAFNKDLTKDMQWNLVNYVKSLITTDSAGGKAIERPGKQIRRINLKGYTLTYHLLDLSEQAEMMKTMGGHSVLGMKKSPDITNHLMVYIENSDGKVMQGDVAFLLIGPDGKDFRTMTMGMYGGYGADINMKLKGVYTIKAKIVIESRDIVRLEDEFTFQMN
ncbi:MAG: c-type cytochrome [Nitrospirae bacterium]|nr:c-type cytochrome [Nitrospirota bacterium]